VDPLTRPLLLLLLLSLGCTKAPAPHAPPAQTAEQDCTLATPLTPGVPGSPGHLIKSARNPNGDSELAVLMRKFVEDLRQARTSLEAGKAVAPWFPTHRKMRCSWPTSPEERNERFDALAQAYLSRVKDFDQGPSKVTYNEVIQGCIACHSASCGGPLDFIDGMRWQ